jgi:transposase-like protein
MITRFSTMAFWVILPHECPHCGSLHVVKNGLSHTKKQQMLLLKITT